MIDLPNEITSSSVNPDRQRMYRVMSILLVTLLVVGGLIAYVNSIKLNKNESSSSDDSKTQSTAPVTYKGIVTYLGEDMYANDGITYSLTNSNGDDIILLKSSDQKLSIAQGLYVTVTGKKGKTLNGESDVLQVTEVTLNGSN
jgi:flagellar basal body-associated protein FliL